MRQRAISKMLICVRSISYFAASDHERRGNLVITMGIW